MGSMFSDSKFNGDISKWNISNVIDMGSMFYNSKFNGDISNWDISRALGVALGVALEASDFSNKTPRELIKNFYESIYYQTII